jgi:5-formyltetrahydrofolate cyclo-ligase
LALLPSRQRLGYGGGFYDRTLSGLDQIMKIGVTHQHPAALTWAAAPHDVILDHCLWL